VGPGVVTGSMLELTDDRRAALSRLVAAWVDQRLGNEARRDGGADGDRDDGSPPPTVDPASVTVRQVEVLRPGRPGVLDVIADVDGRLAHAVLGLRRPGEEVHLLRAADQPVLGLLEDDDGLALVVDGLRDADVAPQVLAAVAGDAADPGPVVSLVDDDEATTLAVGQRSLTVFPWLHPEPHPGVGLLVALDDAGFNHLAAPLALWRRGGLDLGLVQEQLSGSAEGWALALTSLRDLYARGGRPEDAGGDFGSEARALGTMTARMHLALDRAFGRRTDDVADWVDGVEASIAATAVGPGTGIATGTSRGVSVEPGVEDSPVGPVAAGVLRSLRAADLRAAAIRTHGDFHLGRMARTDHGWVVADCTPGGASPGSVAPAMRSPLADVADVLWSLHRVAQVAASDRDPADRAAVAPLADAWEVRNRRAFMAGYVATPGIGGLLPANRDHLVALVAAFELARDARQRPGV
jgi:maltokinase